MKKLLSFLLVFVIVVLAGLLISALILPQDILVSRTILIKAPKEEVFEQMVKFGNWPKWNPWLLQDTNAKLTYTGTDGTPGSAYSWDSKVTDVGAGTSTNKEVSGTQMSYHIDISKPHAITAEGTLSAKDSAGMTKATWTLNTHCPFPLNGLQVFPFLDLDRIIGGAFERGLQRLKANLEGNPAPAPVTPAIEITEVEYPGHMFEGIRQTVSWNDLMKFIDENYDVLMASQVKKTGGPATGLFYMWDTATKSSDMAIAFPIADSLKHGKTTTIIHVEPSKALMAVQKGPYSTSMAYHGALEKAVAAKGQTPGLVIEEYVVGPKQDADSTKWVTNIYYLVK